MWTLTSQDEDGLIVFPMASAIERRPAGMDAKGPRAAGFMETSVEKEAEEVEEFRR